MLLLLASLGFMVIYFILAKKITMRYLISQLYTHKLASVIGGKLTELVATLLHHKPEWWRSINDAKSFKTKLAFATNDNSVITCGNDNVMHKVQRKVMLYALQRAELDDIDFTLSNTQLANEVGSRVMAKLSALAKASSSPFWIAVSAHIMLAILAFILDH